MTHDLRRSTVGKSRKRRVENRSLSVVLDNRSRTVDNIEVARSIAPEVAGRTFWRSFGLGLFAGAFVLVVILADAVSRDPAVGAKVLTRMLRDEPSIANVCASPNRPSLLAA